MDVSFDQHFMTDKKTLQRMVLVAGVGPADVVLEIGAGTGNLTAELAKKAGAVIAVEIDERLKVELEQHKEDNVTLVFGNSLKLLKTLSFTKIVANPPYAIAEPLLRQLAYLTFECAVLTLPERFVQRLQEKKGVLGIFAGAFFSLDIVAKVPKTAFIPEPRTDSVMVILRKREPTAESAVLSMETKRVKNALIAVLTRRGKTKREARSIVGGFTERELLDKTMSELCESELNAVLMFIKECG